MNFPKEKNAIINLANQYNLCIASKNMDEYPEEMKELFKDVSLSKALLGTALHLILHIFIKCFTFLNIWFLVGILTKLRIRTDSWAFDPRQCGYNAAYTTLGLCYIKRGNVFMAIKALQESWQVYPCPHNTSYGLRTELVKVLQNYPEANEAINHYREVYNAFKA